MISPGSQWHRWEPHIHAPGTVLNDRFGGGDPWDVYLTKIEIKTPLIRALAVTDYYLTDLYEQVLQHKEDGRLPHVDLIFPNIESVRRLYVGLQSFRSMSRMDASLMKASALRLRFSQSLASRRQRLSQAMVRSTTQRLGWTTKPFTRSDRLTISVSRSGRMPARAR